MKPHVRLRGMTGPARGRTWESSEVLRIGRLETLEVVLDDPSVSRIHAEVRLTERGWRLRDLGSTNGTRLNAARLQREPWPVRPRDLIQVGEVALVVEALEEGAPQSPSPDELQVEATVQLTWELALQGLAFDRNNGPRPGEQLLALLRAGHYLVHVENEDEFLAAILNDAVAVLDAQRGAIALVDSPNGSLRLRATATGRGGARAAGKGEAAGRPAFSQSLAQRSFGRGESVLCQSAADDAELAAARSIADGAMGSALCALLRTPRKRLGVLHLDRAPWQRPFTADDLHLADALAASVSAGIETAQLLRRQRDLFLNTITLLAQAVELRDQYTGGHTARVTGYALLLGQQLGLPAADVDLLRVGTPLHDIGKIGIDDAILRKPDRLTPAEFDAMKQHTVKGAEILGRIPEFQPILDIVRSHHERWDGRGYPDGLAGDAIPLLARVVAVADAFDAMTSDRPYRPGMAAEAAFAELEKMSGLQFDPRCVAAFLAMCPRVVQEMDAQRETAIVAPVLEARAP